MFDQFESMLGNGGLSVQSNYPPYNIRKAGKDKYAIEVALAGFNKDDVEVEYEDNLLTVKTKEVKKAVEKDEDGDIIHRGISQRSFARSFTIADDVKVNGAELKDGPSFNSAPFTFTSSAIVNDLANDLCDIPR
jgi:molecular chaperone IbpA